MSMDGEQPVIIVVKKGGGHGGHHGGSWKVAIADLMTAMMAMFMVLWLIGQSPKTRAAVGAYFRDPMGLAGGGNTDTSRGPMSGGSGFFDGGNTVMSQDLMISPGQIVLRVRGQGAAKRKIVETQAAKQRLAQALLRLRQQDWARNVELSAVEEGLRIEIQDTEKQPLFKAGNTAVTPLFHTILKRVAKELKVMPNHLVIEGHTDSSGRNNWEVSVARANAARVVLESQGVRSSQIVEVRGYADRRLRLWHDPRNPRNRRVSVLVLLDRGRRPTPPDKDPSPEHALQRKLNDLDARSTAPPNRVELDGEGRKLPPTPNRSPQPKER